MTAGKGGWRVTHNPSRGDLGFRRAREERYSVFHLRPLKKGGAGPAEKVPQLIAEHDGSGSDTYAALAALTRLDPVEAWARGSTPLFRIRRGGVARPMTVGQFRAAVKRYARILGFKEEVQWGAHSPRIGGASDLASTGEACELLVKARGRWASDIAAIYARMTRRSQLAASRLMQKARGRDLEELMPGFTQQA